MSIDNKLLFRGCHALRNVRFPRRQQCSLGQCMNRRSGLKTKALLRISFPIKHCKNCNIIYSHPLPVPWSVSDHYQIRPEGYWSKSYFYWTPEYFVRQLSDVRSLLDAGINTLDQLRALDISCGIGKAIFSLSRAGFDVWCIEPSPSFHAGAIELTGLN